MTDRLYYHNSFLYDFVAALEEVRHVDGRTALVLDRTAFYPTSGGQVFDTGWLELEVLEDSPENSPTLSATEADKGRAPAAHQGGAPTHISPKLRVAEVTDAEDGAVLHFVEGEVPPGPVRVRGFLDVERRRDHMQQHSGQHILSAAFVELFQMPTVSFHMGEESCTIDLETKSLSAEQVAKAEMRANQVILENRAVGMHFVTAEKAREMGVRKIPPTERDQLRLIEVRGFDLCACGGTHVKATGQVGSILCRKVEKVKQGFRVEFVCGERAVRTARRDYETLVESGGLFSTHVWEVPASIRKLVDDGKTAGKVQHKLLEEIAELRAAQLLAGRDESGVRVIADVFADRELTFVKLLAQKLTQSSGVVALLGAGVGQPTLVFAQSPGGKNDMGGLMKEAMAKLGGRGGGNKDMAQGGVPEAGKLQGAVDEAKARIE
jgi:alanyl-tRNA synthetase